MLAFFGLGLEELLFLGLLSAIGLGMAALVVFLSRRNLKSD